MPNDLQSPNWNQTKLDPQDLATQVSARLETIAKDHNKDPSKFMAMIKGGGDTFGFGDMKTSNPMHENESKGAASSSFLMMGKTQSKKGARVQQLNSKYDAMGLPKSYKQMKEDSTTYSRIMTGGRVKRNNDPFSGGGDRALAEQVSIARQSLGTEGGYVSPQGIKANPWMAQQLGAGQLYDTMLDARREDQAPAEYRALTGAIDGNAKLQDAAKQVNKETTMQFVQQQDDPKPVATLLLGDQDKPENRVEKIKGPKPPAGPSPNGLMEA